MAGKISAAKAAMAGLEAVAKRAAALAEEAPMRAPAAFDRRSKDQQLTEETLRMAARPPMSYANWRKADRKAQGDLFSGTKTPMLRAPLGVRPDVPQFDLPRHQAPKGASKRMVRAMANPRVAEGLNEAADRGLKLGGPEWYDTAPLLEKYSEILGPEAGAEAFRREMMMVGATSPGAPVTDNIKIAGYFNNQIENGQLPRYPSEGYGGKTNPLRQDNIRQILDNGALNPHTRPKASSFTQNLLGNWRPIAVDTHNLRLAGMLDGSPDFLAGDLTEGFGSKGMERDAAIAALLERYPQMKADYANDRVGAALSAQQKVGINHPTVERVHLNPREMLRRGIFDLEEAQQRPGLWDSTPSSNEYGPFEAFQQEIARVRGMDPAQYQAAMWLGAGEKTGLASEIEPFTATKDARVRYQADMLGEDPELILRLLAQAKIPALAEGGHVDRAALTEKYEL